MYFKTNKIMQEEITVDNNNDVQVARTFEYGDLYLKCSCGSDVKLGECFNHGISFVMLTKSDSFWKLECSECGNSMTLYFKESTEESILKLKEKEKENNEPVYSNNDEETLSNTILEDVEPNDGVNA